MCDFPVFEYGANKDEDTVVPTPQRVKNRVGSNKNQLHDTIFDVSTR